MKLIGRSRRGGSAYALLVAVLMVLAAPMINCAVIGSGEHSHEHGVPVTAAETAALEAPDHGFVDGSGEHCPAHAAHCIVQATLPGLGVNLHPLYLLLFVFAAAGALAVCHRAAVGGVRGPPLGIVPTVSGRVLLTRICIARR